MEKDVGFFLKVLCVDGGVSVNNFFMQFQFDMLNVQVEWLKIIEIMVLGVVYLAGLVMGYWKLEELEQKW